MAVDMSVSRATKAMEALMKERRKRRERGGAIEAEATPTSDQDQARQFSDPRSLHTSVSVCMYM